MTPRSAAYYSESILGTADPEELKPNMANLYTFMFLMVLSGINLGYMDYSNQAAALYNAQYKWMTPHEITVNQQYIGASIILGCTIGAASGGKLMQWGRRRALFITCAVGMVGVSFTLLKDFQM